MALPKTDAFTAANGTALHTYDAGWVANDAGGGHDFVINTNACAANGSGVDFASHWSSDAFDADQYAQATVAAISTAQIGVAVRCASGNTVTYYGLYAANGAGSQLFKNVAASWTQIGSDADTFAANDVMRLEGSGTTLTGKKNGSNISIGARTDTSIASGYAGVCQYDASTGSRVDSFSGGNLSSAPTPSVSDAVATGESVTLAVGSPKPSVSDAVTVAEAVTVALPAGTRTVSVTEAVATGEAVSATVGAPKPSVTDAVAAAESVTLAVGTPRPSVTDAVSTGETVTLSVGSPKPSVTDSVTAAETVTVAVGTPAPSVTDAITTGESVTLVVGALAARTVSVSDAVTAGETVTITPLLLAGVSVTDSVTAGESVNVSVGVAGARQVSVSESVTVSDAPTVSTSALAVSVSDSATVTDSPTAYFGFTVSVTDAVAVTDTPAVGMTRRISVSDAATVGETVTTGSSLYVSVTDAISTTDAVSFTPLLVYVSVTDAVVTAESVSASFAAPITAWVTLTLNDRPQSFILPARDDIYVLHARAVTLETEDR